MTPKTKEEIEQILYAPNLNITQREYCTFIDEVVPKILTVFNKEREEAYTKGYNAGLADGTNKPLLAIEQIQEERDTYWKERVRKEVERLLVKEYMKGSPAQYQNKILITLLDNLK